MSGTVLLVLGLAALMGALVLAAVAFAGGARGVEGGLVAIERQYGQHVAARPSLGARELSPLLDRLRLLAVRLSPGRFAGSLQRRLDLAGNPERWTVDRVLAFKALGLIGLGLLGLLFGVHHPITLVLYPAVGAVAGFFLPDVLVYNAGVKRQDKISKALPDTLDMLTVCVEAGLGFDAALAQVARNTEGPLSALADRTTVGELRVFVSALVQASELGVPVARVLREESTEMRVRRRQRAEERAQKVPVKILFPLIFCLFPALFVIVIGPGGINIMHSLMGR